MCVHVCVCVPDSVILSMRIFACLEKGVKMYLYCMCISFYDEVSKCLLALADYYKSSLVQGHVFL